MPLKVCVITSVHNVFDNRIFQKECKTLVKAGYDVTLLAQHDKSEVVDGGITIVPLSGPRNRFVRMTGTTWQAYRNALAIDADIYHLHDPELLLIGILLKLHGKKIIYDMHENLPKQIKSKDWINPKLRRILSMAVYWTERLLLIGTPVIFAEYSYRKDYLWVKKCTTVLNMPLINELLPFKYDTSVKHGFAVGYMGGVSDARGSLTTIEALKILKDDGISARFECIGPIAESHKQVLLKKCGEYNLSNVVFHGYLPAHKGWHVIGQCSVGLALLHPIPNYIESYPTKIFEYMAMGLPVITSNFPLYRAIIEENDCGLCVDPMNPEEIAGAIQWIMEHPVEAEHMGQNGRRAVEEKFNWGIEEKKLLSVYRELLQG